MSLNRLTAYFACDECGANFAVGLDPAYTPPPGWSLFDCAVDGVRGAVDYEDVKSDARLGCSSVQSDKHLCAACTDKADAEAPPEPECHTEGNNDG